jgi:hypothetical protein
MCFLAARSGEGDQLLFKTLLTHFGYYKQFYEISVWKLPHEMWETKFDFLSQYFVLENKIK